MASMRGTAQLAEKARQDSFKWPSAEPPKIEPWLTVKDVCAATQLVDSTVRKYVTLGKLKAYRVGDSNDLRFKEADVIAFMTATPAAKVEVE